MELTFGIDLGTSRSCICTVYKQQPTMIPVGNTNLLPSYVSFKKDGYVVGESAKNRSIIDVGNVVYATKRLIGRKFSDKEVQEDIMNMNFCIEQGMEDNILIQVDITEDRYTPVDIAKIILQELKKYADEFVKKYRCDVAKKAVICVPAYFSDKQRKDTELAAKLAGFEVLRIINEPTAAAIAYSYDKTDVEKPTKMMVYDLGAGTFDVSIIEVLKGNISVIGSYGDSHLGGEDFTNALFNYMKKEIERTEDITIRNRKDIANLRNKCEEAKVLLSTCKEFIITFGKDETEYTISRNVYSELIKDLLNKTIDIVNETLTKYRIRNDEIEEVILIGGGSKMPQIPAYLNTIFPLRHISQAINAEEAVSQGAARFANDLIHEKSIVVKNKHSGKISIKRSGDPIPPDEEIKIDYSGRTGDLNSSVVLNRITEELELVDIRSSSPSARFNVIIPPVSSIPKVFDKVNHSYGVEIQDNALAIKKMYFMIKAGTDLPAAKSKQFESIQDNQENITIKIFEGENDLTEYNNFLEKITFGPFERMRKGEYKFEIVFDVDINGNLSVKARHEGVELGAVRILINN